MTQKYPESVPGGSERGPEVAQTIASLEQDAQNEALVREGVYINPSQPYHQDIHPNSLVHTKPL